MNIDQFYGLAGSYVYKSFLLLVYLFSLLPVLIVFIMALGPSEQLEFPPSGITLKWYAEAFAQFSQYGQPLLFSLQIALIVGVLSTVLGTLAAYVLIRHRPRFTNSIQATFSAPLAVPQIVVGLALLIFFYQVSLPTGRLALIVGHTVIGIPYVVIFVTVSIENYDASLELSARDLGADRYQTFRYVTIPLIKSGIFAGGVFSFITSYNNVPISLFLIEPGQTTIPMAIFQNLSYGFTPTLAAVAVVQVSVVFILVAASNFVIDIEEIF